MQEKPSMQFNRKFFDPELPGSPRTPPDAGMEGSDRHERQVYVYYDDKITLAINAALAAGRPLLIEGPPGSGKSSLALDVAQKLGWRDYERVVTSRTSAQDLLWEFDALRRLNDAQLGNEHIRPREAYVEPGVLWWVFDPHGAAVQGQQAKPPRQDPGMPGQGPEAVLLLDEIDKADPDVPNDLLVPLGAGQFEIKETGTLVKKKRGFFLVITTNGERDLAPAFVRRCVRLKLEHPNEGQLVKIAQSHFEGRDVALYQPVAEWVVKSRQEALQRGIRPPSTAEFLDAIRACGALGIEPGSSEWKTLSQLILAKADAPGGVA